MLFTPNSLKSVSWSKWNAARCNSAAGCCSAVKFRRERRSSPIIGSTLNKVSHVEGLVLRWNILSGHLATDSCFCPVPGILMHIGQRTRHVLQSTLHCLSSQGQVDVKTDRMCGLSFRVFFIEKFNFSPAEARAVNRYLELWPPSVRSLLSCFASRLNAEQAR